MLFSSLNSAYVFRYFSEPIFSLIMVPNAVSMTNGDSPVATLCVAKEKHQMGAVPLFSDAQVESKPFPFQRQVKSLPFPLVLTPKATSSLNSDPAAFHQWLKANGQQMQALIRQYGGVVFRGFAVETPEVFNDTVEAIGMEALPYVGGAAPRKVVCKNVFTSNEAPPAEKIPFHHEMAQVPTYPSYIFFYCDVQPGSGGATPILRSDELYETVNGRLPDFVQNLEKRGVVYTRVLPAEDDPASPIGRSWPSTFHSTDPKVAAEKAQTLGVTLEWLPDGNCKSVSGVLPAVKPYKHDTSRKVFFNSMVAAYVGWKDCRNNPETAVTYGDGARLEKDNIETVKTIMEEICVAMPWQKGDVMMLDNNLCMHSRQPFEPPRRILAYVAK